ncbi:MAG: hypothetical protein AB7F40_06000 [Victivallaceae bacterium]|nr:hypothetical protein [Victivallaceae bacterium]
MISAFTILLAGSAFAAVWFRRRLEYTLAPWCAFGILLLFVFACFRHVGVGLDVWAGLSGLLWLGALVGGFLRRNRGNWRFFFTPGLVFFLFCGVAAYILLRGRCFQWWDEYSHWGLAARTLFETGLMPCFSPADFLFPDYPAGGALFQYLFLKTVSPAAFREWLAIYATVMLIAAGCAAALCRVGWRSKLLVPALLSAFLLPQVFSVNLYSIHADGAMGALFGCALAMSLLRHRPDVPMLMFWALPVLALPLFKPAGMFYAAAAMILEFALILGCRRRRVAGIVAWSVILLLLVAIKLWLGALVAGLPEGVAASRFSWDALVGIGGDPRRLEILWRVFSAATFKPPLEGSLLPVVWWAGLLTFLFIWARRKAMAVMAPLLLTFLLGTLLYLYWFVFSYYEAIHLSSFDRYFWTTLLGLGIAAVASVAARRSVRAMWLSALILAVTGGFCLGYSAHNFWNWQQPVERFRGATTFANSQLARMLEPGESFTIIDQGSKGQARIGMRYFWGGRYVLDLWYYLAPPGLGGDDFVCGVKPEIWYDMLREANVGCIYVMNADALFADAYGAVFDGPVRRGRLYRRGRDGRYHPLPIVAFVDDFEQNHTLLFWVRARRTSAFSGSWGGRFPAGKTVQFTDVSNLPREPLAGLTLMARGNGTFTVSDAAGRVLGCENLTPEWRKLEFNPGVTIPDDLRFTASEGCDADDLTLEFK